MANQSSRLDRIFAALADPTRRAIVMRLCAGEASVGELADPFDMALPSFMKHIHALETSGLVLSEKSGRVRTCRLSPDALVGAEDWFQQQRAVWEARLDRFEDYVMKLKKERAGAKRPSRTTKRKGS
ncbi:MULTISPECIES: ArsR/SmtB family transcription factor [Bradyrhizobium]|uniref:Helix-turn-helix transcriptional regulator n=1 Tax=Bradyrhizobium vignae TaxID=1549949 RepID=A0A2U3Q0A7_9BRAD|nr:metalloregulator ArsR/SmtB family transcription factor [Bradyrhizobium vignae]MBP0114724.1 helix-turn-helix transcriptional regulator [Bradyrhizobium vignae]RXH04527.1 transcriptional regulator [Bradyrhizobium vignae]SPP94806.1 Transcriptional regulatory protein [Bradyrhizobium vignae]